MELSIHIDISYGSYDGKETKIVKFSLERYFSPDFVQNDIHIARTPQEYMNVNASEDINVWQVEDVTVSQYKALKIKFMHSIIL